MVISAQEIVFVAMPFQESFREVYEDAIAPSIEANGLTPLRVDELLGHRDIVEDIEEGIRKSLVVFADLTGKNANVFYEVGFARALGKQFIVATQSPDDVPFDLRQRRYIQYATTGRGLKEFAGKLKEWIKHTAGVAREAKKFPGVICHGTKFDVPNRNEFWNDLLRHAKRRFYLVGSTNKSWVDKGEEQCTELGDSIIRIVSDGGEVKVLSNEKEEIITTHRTFFSRHVLKKLDRVNNQERSSMLELLRQNLSYGVCRHSNYGAVVSDDRLVLLPTVNSSNFRDETLVLEIQGSTLQQFKNYLADIDRIFRNGCTKIDITSEKL